VTEGSPLIVGGKSLIIRATDSLSARKPHCPPPNASLSAATPPSSARHPPHRRDTLLIGATPPLSVDTLIISAAPSLSAATS
jgi:hypothetical protein